MRPYPIVFTDHDDPEFVPLDPDQKSELAQLLYTIGQQKSVIGSLLIGCNGILIASTLPPELDAELIGRSALGIYMNTCTCVSKLGHDEVNHIVARTSCGYVVIGDFGGGLLVIMNEDSATEALIPFMRSLSSVSIP